VQIFFAGFGAFDNVHKLNKDGSTIDQDSFNHSFDLHIALGYFIWLGGVIFLLISFGTRTRSRIYRALAVFGLLTLQVLLAWIGYGVPYVAGGLHPINAFVILGFLGSITYREWRGGREAAVEPATV
jgi:heme A synthase